MQHILDVVRGTAVKGPFPPGDFINLRQGAFHKTGGAAHDGHHPHPEDSARSAQHDGYGDAGDVAYAYAAGRTDAESLERGNLVSHPFCPDAFRQQADHFPNIPDLDKSGTERKIQPQSDQQDNQDVGPEDRVDLVNDSV